MTLWNSMRGRFIVTASLLLLGFLGFAVYAQNLVQYTRTDSQHLIDRYYGSHRTLENTKDTLRRAEADLYAYAVDADTKAADGLRDAMQTLGRLHDQLLQDSMLAEPELQEPARSLSHMLTRASGEVTGLLVRGGGLRGEERIALARETVAPMLKGAYKLVHLVERRIYDAVLGKTFQSLGASEIMSKLTRGAAIVVCLFMVAAYTAFELSIRRPLLKVAQALEEEGHGGTPTPVLPDTGMREVALLVAAFKGMRAQVRSRQLRLESVLNNTSDGIVTFDDAGRIHAINTAAAGLFGYDEAEVIGQDVAMLLTDDGDPSAARAAFDDRFLHRETIVLARRKNATLFDMSCKVSEFTIDGDRLFNVMVADVSERKALFDRLTYLAQRDPLTALYNRRYFMEELGRATERAKRGKGLPMAVLVIDLDHFKLVNDTLGHQAGDTLLSEIAGRLKKRSRDGDLAARLGGDEFAVLVFDVDAAAAESVAASYCAKLSGGSFHAAGRHIEISCSVGVALLTSEIAGRQDVLARADLACRVAKQSGRNRFHCYRPEDEGSAAQLSGEIGYARLIGRALAEGRLVLAFQPIVATADGAPCLHEVLVRLVNEDGTLLPAQAFVPEAERLGLAPDLDAWVIGATFAAIAAGRVPAGSMRFAINVSGCSIGDPRVIQAIGEGLERFAIDPRSIVLEVTESAAMTGLSQAKAFFDWARGLGCETTLADFGAGYASFLHLRDLTTDYVKLDGELVRGIASDPLNLAAVKAMNDVAQTLGRKTIAEFVENEEIARRLQAIGVNYVQGFHFGHPVVQGTTVQ